MLLLRRSIPAVSLAALVAAVACSSTVTGGDADGLKGSGGAAGSVKGSGGDPGDPVETGGSSSGGSISGSGGAASGGTSQGGSVGSGGATVKDAGGVVTNDGAAGSAINCVGSPPSFPEFDKSCATADDCELVAHTTSCCGDQLLMGINREVKNAFQEAEQICNDQYPGCGCASQGVKTEAGEMLPWSMEGAVLVECVEQQCRTRYEGSSFACGTRECLDFQYCIKDLPNDVNAEPAYHCGSFFSECRQCSCIPQTCSECFDPVDGGAQAGVLCVIP